MPFFRRDGTVATAVGQALAGIEVFVCSQPADTTDFPPSPLINLFASPLSNTLSISSISWELGILQLVLPALSADLVVGSYIQVQGANPSTFNGVYLVEAIDMDTNTVTVSLPDNPGTYLSGATIATSALPNPLLSDGLGNFFFYAPAGDYTVVFFDPAAGLPTQIFPDQEVVSPGAGTVTSVGLAGDGNIFNPTVPGSPITVAGVLDLAAALLTQGAMFVLSGPLTGVAAKPTFKSFASLLAQAGVGSGTVTSVDISFGGSSLFSFAVSGDPITSAGTIALTLNFANQAANTVLAGPISGGAGPITPRALVFADIPPGLVINWRGPWDSSATYAVGDAVSIAGSSYIAIAGSTNVTPPNLSFWNLLAQAAGAPAGVNSLNTLQGDIRLTSIDSSVKIVVTGATIDLSAAKNFGVGIYNKGVGANADVLYYNVLPLACTFPAGAPQSQANSKIAATGSTVFTLKKNGSAFATVTWSASGTAGAWVQASTTTFNGTTDIFEIDGPATADATLADFGINIVGTLN
jgi:hypothetical protein